MDALPLPHHSSLRPANPSFTPSGALASLCARSLASISDASRDYGRRDDYYDYRAPPPRRDERDYRRDDRCVLFASDRLLTPSLVELTSVVLRSCSDYRPREDYPPRRDEPRRDEPRRDEPRRDYDDRRPAAYDQRRERSPPPRQRSRSPAPAGGDAPREAAPVRDEDRAQEGAPAQGGADAWN